MKTVQIASLLFSAFLFGCATSPDRPMEPEKTELHAMSGSELIVLTRTEPARAFGLIWDALEIDSNSDIITWCTHKQGIQEVEPCREYVLTQAGILLDTTQFGTPDEVAGFLGGTGADGHAVALALGPVFEEQFAGGFAQPLGRVLAGRKIREEQQRRHKRMLESRGAVRVFVDARDTRKPTQELVDEILSAFESDPSAVVDLLFASASAAALQQLLIAMDETDVQAARARLKKDAERTLRLDAIGGVSGLVERQPSADPRVFIDWITRSVSRSLNRDGGLGRVIAGH